MITASAKLKCFVLFLAIAGCHNDKQKDERHIVTIDIPDASARGAYVGALDKIGYKYRIDDAGKIFVEAASIEELDSAVSESKRISDTHIEKREDRSASPQ